MVVKIVGLTGGIGSGKSTVARIMVELGARLVDADVLAREVVLPGRPAWKDIVAEFGPEVLNDDQTINRERLAALVFNDEARRQRLMDITHPRIGQEMLGLIKAANDEGVPVCVIDAALLLESPATRWIKPVIVVKADEDIRLERVCARDSCDSEEAGRRMRSQWSDEERARLADYVIDNSGDQATLEKQVHKVWKAIVKA